MGITKYIRGLFDGDGSITAYYYKKHNGVSTRIKITNGCPNFSNEILLLLSKLEIYSKVRLEQRNNHKWWNINIERHSDILRFIEIINSSHPKKKRKMQEIKKILLEKKSKSLQSMN